MLESPDGTGTLVEDRRDVADGKIPQDTQQDDFGLICREVRDPSEGFVGSERRERLVLDVADASIPPEHFARSGRRFADGRSPALVEEPSPGDRECPRPEAGLVPREPMESRSDIQPHL